MYIILASGSPRRRELLGRIYPVFDVITADVDETLPSDTPPEKGVKILALRKGESVQSALGDDPAYADALILSSDTLVELDGEPLGTPRDEAEAKEMLARLSGRTHYVRTGIAVRYHGRVKSGVATSAVHFRPLSDEEIEAYVATGEPMDKAGAYGIQGKGGRLVASYDGDFDTIMGLSLALTTRLIDDITTEEG